MTSPVSTSRSIETAEEQLLGYAKHIDQRRTTKEYFAALCLGSGMQFYRIILTGERVKP